MGKAYGTERAKRGGVPDDPIVAMHAVTRRFGDLAAVDAVTLDVPHSTILGVIGPSGSGKTTLIRMLTGTLEPSDGSLLVLGQNPRKFTRHAREKIGYMPQHEADYCATTPYGKSKIEFEKILLPLLPFPIGLM